LSRSQNQHFNFVMWFVSLIFCKLLVGAARCVVGAVHPLALNC